MHFVIHDQYKIGFESQAEAEAYALSNSIESSCVVSESELNERSLARLKRESGNLISSEMIDLLGARNKVLGLSSSQITSMLSQLAPVKTLLETGALGTARTYIAQFKAGFTYHADIFQTCIDMINTFEEENGL